MGKPGPAATPTDVLARRGSWRAQKRNQEDREARRSERLRRQIPPNQDPTVLPELIKTLPGYDPYAGADGFTFDREGAALAIDFFQQKLSHVKGEKTGQAFILENWEKAIIANIFGWKSKKIGLRRFREAFIEVARKNGKTPLAAGIILYLLFEDQEPGAEIYGAASEYKQASLVFTHCWGMVRQEPELEAKAKIYKGQAKCIEVGVPGDPDYGTYRVISSDAFSAHGFNTAAAVVDELHTQPNSELVDALLTSTGARRQPLIVYITTSDYEREGSVCNEKEDYALKVRDGIIRDLSFLPVVYQASLEDDWTSEATWRKANPNLGVSVSLDYLRRECKRAQETPTYENTFKRLHLNIRTQQDVRWIPIEAWDGCAGAVDEDDLTGHVCWAGLDLSSTADLAAFVMVFREPDGIMVVPRFWVPKENAVKRQRRDKVPYITWADQDLITLTDGNVVDYDVIRVAINELGKKFNIKQIAIDRWNATQITTQLQGDGFEVLAFGQGFASMSAPAKELERLILEGGLSHGGHSVLRWSASNVAAEIDAAGNIKPSKKKSPERIDGIVALTMALGAMIAAPEKTTSIYEERGALVF